MEIMEVYRRLLDLTGYYGKYKDYWSTLKMVGETADYQSKQEIMIVSEHRRL